MVPGVASTWRRPPLCLFDQAKRFPPVISSKRSESRNLSRSAFSLSLRVIALPLSFRASEALSPCHFERSTKCEVEKSVLNRAAALLSTFRLPTAELRSATPRYGPSQNLLRHHFVITCIFRAPSPCPLRGWICPPCGSLKALHRSAAPSCKSPYTAENAKASNIKVLTFSVVAGEHK